MKVVHYTMKKNILKSILITSLLCLLTIASASADTLSVGDTMPEFTLTNHNGKKTSLSDFKGKGVIMSFLYTQCPFPNKCPMIKNKLSSLAALTNKIGKADQIQVLAVTIDPKNDTPEVLKQYAQGFDKSHKNWLFLTGSEEAIAQLAGGLGVLYWDQNGVIEHNMRTVFIGPDGVIRIIKSGADWKAGEFGAQIKPYLK